MLTVAILDNHEKKVIDMTYELLWKELQDITGAKLVVVDSWWEALADCTTDFICFVEADCLVSGGYFSSQVGIFKKDRTLRKLAVMGSALGVLNWANRVYGYSFGNKHSNGLVPERVATSNRPYPVQVAYIPGAIMRTKVLQTAVEGRGKDQFPVDNLVAFSARLSLLFWASGSGHRIVLNPSTTYVTTEKYPLDISHPDIDPAEAMVKFTKAGIL